MSQVAIFALPSFGWPMIDRTYPDLSEVAYHIVSLCDFWKRSPNQGEDSTLIRVIQKMVEISLGIENAQPVARAVIQELQTLRNSPRVDAVEPDGIEVVFIAALLHEQIDELRVPAASAYWAAVFD